MACVTVVAAVVVEVVTAAVEVVTPPELAAQLAGLLPEAPEK